MEDSSTYHHAPTAAGPSRKRKRKIIVSEDEPEDSDTDTPAPLQTWHPSRVQPARAARSPAMAAAHTPIQMQTLSDDSSTAESDNPPAPDEANSSGSF